MRDLEPEPGVEIVRREFIRVSAGALGAILLGGCLAADRGRPGARAPRLPLVPDPAAPFRPLTWDEFAGELVPRAEAVLAQRMGEEDYVGELAWRLRQIDPGLVPSPRDLPRHRLFQVVEFRLAPGHGFRYHDHRHYNGVIYVLDGAVACRSFDLEGRERAPARGRRVRIRQTSAGLLRARETSTLTSRRDNIHDVRGSPGGCRLLDIFTWMGPGARSVYLDVDERPLDPEGTLFQATFAG